MTRFLCSVLFAALLLAAAVPNAFAGCATCAAVFNPCGRCYTPQYRTVYDTVQVAPARVVTHLVPARYGVVNETVMVRPPQQAWQSTCACGRETLQAVAIPAEYASVPHTVMVEPAHVVREVVPPQYATVERTEMVAPEPYWAAGARY
jgi:hypothetical protein